MGRIAVTERTVRDALARGAHKLEIPQDAIITAIASELATSRNLVLVRVGAQSPPAACATAAGSSSSPSGDVGTVVFGSDHGGFALKSTLIAYAATLGYRTVDVGTNDEKPCDYPDFAFMVAQQVAGGKAWRGIMIDGAGIGSCMVVNRVPGILGACCHNEFTARNAREHNNANVLTLGSRVIGVEVCKAIIKVFLETGFAGGRHEDRVSKILNVEKRSRS